MEGQTHKLRVLESHCSAVGRDLKKMEKSCWPGGQIFIALDRKELDRKVLQRKAKSVPLEVFKKLNLVGTPDECIPKIQQYVDLGVRAHPLCCF